MGTRLSRSDELTVRAYSIWLTDRDSAVAFFREQEQHHRQRLARYSG